MRWTIKNEAGRSSDATSIELRESFHLLINSVEQHPTLMGWVLLFLLYCGRLVTSIFCACLFPFDFAFALASWQEDCFELHASSHEKIQGIKSKLQADRSILGFMSISGHVVSRFQEHMDRRAEG
jgi:hypothetical protein